MTQHEAFIQAAIQLAIDNVNNNAGGPFGAVVVKDGQIIARGRNRVIEYNDPTCHAEVVAIREACRVMGDFHLTGCELYSSCEPCPMCLGAIYWARLDKLYYAANQQQAAAVGFNDAFIYTEIQLPHTQRNTPFIHLDHPQTLEPFDIWASQENKIDY